jgi:hypothetical protein
MVIFGPNADDESALDRNLIDLCVLGSFHP